jgi:hypothetical protein
MLNMKSVFVIVGVVASVTLIAPDAQAQRRNGAMGRAATRAAAPRGGVDSVTRRDYPPSRIAPRVVTPYPSRFSRPYRPYYYPYRPGLSVGLYSGYAPYRYGYYGYPYDYPFNYTYFNNYAYNYPYSYAPYRYAPPPAYVTAAPSHSYGGVRIQGAPGDAQVFVDGYYVGRVDDFDGAFQKVNLRSGPHRVEVRAPGLAPVTFDVNVAPGQTITYHAGIR